MREFAALVLLFGGVASAEELTPSAIVHESAATGAFLPFTDSPASPGSIVKAFGVYDGATESSSIVVAPTALLSSWLQLQVQLTYEDGEVQREAQAQLGILEEAKHGVDFQVAGGYDSSGINAVAAGFIELAVGGDLHGTYAMSSVRFDLGFEGGERGFAVSLGSARTITENLYAGVDTQLKLDLERDSTEPMDESSWTLTTGPAVTYAASHFALTVSGGLSADKPRMASREVGAFAAVGVGTAF